MRTFGRTRRILDLDMEYASDEIKRTQTNDEDEENPDALFFPLFLIIVNNQKLIGYYPINICTSTNAELN